MTAAPLVRNEHGAILGIDWRRVPGMADDTIHVPGPIPAWAVMPGDRVGLDGEIVTVLAQAIPPAYTQWLGWQLLDVLVLESSDGEL